MDEQKIRDAIEELRIGTKTCEGIISYNGNFEPKNTCEKLTEKIRNFKTAIEALEKQLPKKVKMRHIKKHDNFNDGWCPCCKSYIQELHFDRNFCQECGQKLDWSE